MQTEQGSTSPSVKFSHGGDFRRTLQKRVKHYFKDTGLDQRDQPAMYLKTAVILGWFFASYAALVFAPLPWWGRVLMAISLGLSCAGIGFSIMHDAGHRAYSKNNWVNQLLFMSLDMLGGSSYVWRFKHNTLHHSFANIDGHDDDIDIGLLGRLSPEQKRLPFHRFQHWYVWPLYGLLVVKWQFWDDFYCWATGKVGGREMPRPKGMDAAVLVGGKLVFLVFGFVVPALIHPVGWVIAFYLLASFVQGIVLATVFQLAHCVEEADFPVPPESHRMEHDWATHQLMTTVDFAQKNPLITWYVGGLNYQVEHHLFPRISHIHYPKLAEIVRETCEEFGVPYHAQPTLWGGIRSHFRHLRRMGRPETASEPTLNAA
ncbi:fatty acid desaturase family protein [Persicimonas caeni]|nr:acyl-CoA desaturase [Persicimonas caeni]